MVTQCGRLICRFWVRIPEGVQVLYLLILVLIVLLVKVVLSWLISSIGQSEKFLISRLGVRISYQLLFIVFSYFQFSLLCIPVSVKILVFAPIAQSGQSSRFLIYWAQVQILLGALSIRLRWCLEKHQFCMCTITYTLELQSGFLHISQA